MFLLRMQFFSITFLSIFQGLIYLGEKKLIEICYMYQGCFKQCGMYQSIDG